MGERDVFPVVGRDTKLRIPGARGSVYPLVTGTFGGVDFLHSVTGERMCTAPFRLPPFFRFFFAQCTNTG